MSVGSTPPVAEPTAALKPNDYKGKVDPDWCAGCGDFGVLKGLQKACADLGIRPHEILTVSGIGCSSNFPGFFNAYGMHTLHGAVASRRDRGPDGEPRAARGCHRRRW